MAKFKLEDIFSITGRGPVLSGRIMDGVINRGDFIIIGDKQVTITGIEMFRKLLETGQPGDNVGLLLQNGQVTVDFVKRFRGDELTITNLSELRDDKLKDVLS